MTVVLVAERQCANDEHRTIFLIITIEQTFIA